MKRFLNKLFGKKPAKKATGLEFAFKDNDGRSYYRYSDEVNMPMTRLAKIQEYTMVISRGLTEQQLDDLLKRAEDLIFSGLKHPRNAASLAAIITEMRERKTKIVPVNVYYNFLAVQYVREDEDPIEVDEEIHREKVEAFAKSAEHGFPDGFFFQLPESKELFKLLNLSTGRWSEVLTESQIQEERLVKLLSITNSTN